MKALATAAKWLGLSSLTLCCMAGCGDKNGNGTPDVQLPSANQVTKSVENAATTIKKEAGPVVVNAASTIKKEAGPVVAKGVQTIDKVSKPAVGYAEDRLIEGKVKAAIIANQTVDANQINIDVKGNAVVLRGRVKNAQEKLLVQQIAIKQAPHYKPVNQLQIAGAPNKK